MMKCDFRILLFFVFMLLISNVFGCKEENDGEVTVEGDPERPKVFFPTHEWAPVNPEEILFAGLHYRMNLETGLKEAKLMENDDGAEYYNRIKTFLEANSKGQKLLGDSAGFKLPRRLPSNEKNDIMNSDTDTKSLGVIRPNDGKELTTVHVDEANKGKEHFLRDVKNLDDFSDNKNLTEQERETVTKKFRTYEQIKQELEGLELMLDDEQNVVRTLINKHAHLSSETEILSSLDDIEYLLHNIDNAQVFIDAGGLSSVVATALSHVSPAVQALGCRLVKACVQNFPKGQIAAYEAGLIPVLLRLAAADTGGEGRVRALSAVGGLVRHFPLAQADLVKSGLTLLTSLLNTESEATAVKVFVLLADLLDERTAGTTEERQQQLAATGLEEALLQQDWCTLLQSHLRRQQEQALFQKVQDEVLIEDLLEALVEAVWSSVRLCRTELRQSESDLALLAKSYLNRASADEDRAELWRDRAEAVLRILDAVKLNRTEL